MKQKLIKQISAVVLGLGIASPLYAVEIINNVSSSASTGGNSAAPAGGGQAGEVIQGESKAEGRIYTEVDGEVITNIDEEVVGPEAKIEKNVEVNLSNATTTATITVGSGEARSYSEPKETNPIIAFLNKIFNYVLSIFS